MKPLVPCLVLTLLLCACHNQQRVKIVVPPVPILKPLPAPALISPADNAAFHAYPRLLTMRWMDVPGAATYHVEVDCYGCCATHQFCFDVGKPTSISHVNGLLYTHEFVGDQPGRWRVWAVDNNGIAGAKSEWRTFSFGRVYNGNVIPPLAPAVEAKQVVSCQPTPFPSPPRGATLPVAIYNPDPEYSEAARRDKITGSLVLSLQIGEDGLVKGVCVARSLRPDLDANAVAAVQMWRFEPAVKDGARISASVNVVIVFQLK